MDRHEDKYVVDRIEGGYAVLENMNGNFHNVLLTEIKGEIKEGGCVIYSAGIYNADSCSAHIEKDKMRIQQKFASLKKKRY